MTQLASKLNEVFDRAYIHGVAKVARADLLFWHGQTKVTKKLFRNISVAWDERCAVEWEYKKDKLPVLLCAYNEYTLNYFFIFGGLRDEKTKEVDPWVKTLNDFPTKAENDVEE